MFSPSCHATRRSFLPLVVSLAFAHLDPGAEAQAARRASGSGRPQETAEDPGRQLFRIESCNLGCVEVGEEALGCSVAHVFVNQEFQVTFNQPFDPASVDPSTLLLVNVATGAHVPLTAFPSPLDPSVLVARPTLAFDAAGRPVFGLREGVTYSLRIPGALLDPIGPHIRSRLGRPNLTLLTCAFVADRGVADVVPGSPTVLVAVDLVTSHDPVTGEPDGFAFDKPAHKARGVHRGTDILFRFDDFMIPKTLLDLETGQSSTIRIAVDPDGNLATPGDQVPVAGSFRLAFDPVRTTTQLFFTPAQELPAGGRASPLVVVVWISKDITDFVGNPLASPRPIVFVPED